MWVFYQMLELMFFIDILLTAITTKGLVNCLVDYLYNICTNLPFFL